MHYVIKKEKLKEYLRQKGNGSVDIILLLSLLIVTLSAITIMGLTERMAKYAKYNVEDAVIVSAMSANVIDLYKAATDEIVVLSCSDGPDDDYYTMYNEDVYEATREACRMAYERFTYVLASSLQLERNPFVDESAYVKQIQINEFSIYNVIDNDIYRASDVNGNISAAELFQDKRGSMTVNGGDSVNYSGIFVDITAQIEILGNIYTKNVKEYIEINGGT